LNALINNISKNTGLKYNKSLHLFYGKFKGYKIFIKLDVNNDLCYIFLSVKYINNTKKYTYSVEDMSYFDNDIENSDYSQNAYISINEGSKDIQYGIKILKATCPMLESISYKDNEIICTIKSDNDSFVLSLYTVLNDIINFCDDNNLAPCCINCGEPKQTVQYSINEHFITVCNHCYNSVYFKYINKTKPEYASHESFISGTLGILIGVLLYSIFLFFLDIKISSYGIMGFMSFILFIPILIGIKLYKVFSGGFFTKKAIIITCISCLIVIFPVLILGEAYTVTKDIKQNLNSYIDNYRLDLEKEIKNSNEEIIKKYKSTEEYFNQNYKEYQENLISRTKISTSTRLVLEDLKNNRSFRLILSKKIIWCISWLFSTIFCISFYKYNYDKNSNLILLC